VSAYTPELDDKVARFASSLWRRDYPVDREEIVQTGRLLVLEVLADKPDATPSYCLTRVKWRISDLYRREDRRRGRFVGLEVSDLDEERFADAQADFADALIDRLDAEDQGADTLVQLRPRHQRVISSIYLDERTYREVAAELGIGLNALKTLRDRAMRALRGAHDERLAA
jgi:RNA polymerase sigma factor (sigma-70 family)